MKPHQLFPSIEPSVVLDAIGRTPYLDVQWQFQLNLKDFVEHYRDLAPYVPAATSFAAFREDRRSRARFKAVLDEGDLFRDLDLFSDYVLGLHKDDVNEDLVVELFRRFLTFVEDDVARGDPADLLNGSALIALLLAPAVRWAPLLPKRQKDVVGLIETALLAVSRRVHGRGFSADL